MMSGLIVSGGTAALGQNRTPAPPQVGQQAPVAPAEVAGSPRPSGEVAPQGERGPAGPPAAVASAVMTQWDCPGVSRQGVASRPGSAAARACALGFLRDERRLSLTRVAEVTIQEEQNRWQALLSGSEMLSEFYRVRGEGSQAIHDGGAIGAGLGGAGAALSGGAGASTVAAWGYVALANILVVNFTGSQPRADLYHAGHLGVGFVENRYLVLFNRVHALTRLPADYQVCRVSARPVPPGAAVTGEGAAEAAAPVPDWPTSWLATVEGWPDASDKTAILPTLRRMHEICSQIVEGEGRLTELTARLDVLDELWPAHYADDLLALDSRLERADIMLRPTPGSALTLAASGTLRALDSLISGQNSQEAVNRVRINGLLDNMSVTLTPIRVGAVPALIDTGAGMTPEILARAVVRDRKAEPTNKAVDDVIDWIRRCQSLIEADRRIYNERAFMAGEIQDAASRSVLQFDYQVDTGVASVGLVTPGAPPPAQPQPLVQPPLSPK